MSRGEKCRKNFKFDSILDNKIFHCELQNVAKHCAISSECSSPHDPRGFSSHSFIQHPLLALFLLADVKTIHQEREPQYVQYRNCSDNSPGVSSGRHSLVGRRHHLCRLDSYSCLLPQSIASPRQRSGEILLISPLSVTLASTIASSTSFCAALSASLNHFRARSISASKVVPSKSR